MLLWLSRFQNKLKWQYEFTSDTFFFFIYIIECDKVPLWFCIQNETISKDSLFLSSVRLLVLDVVPQMMSTSLLFSQKTKDFPKIHTLKGKRCFSSSLRWTRCHEQKSNFAAHACNRITGQCCRRNDNIIAIVYGARLSTTSHSLQVFQRVIYCIITELQQKWGAWAATWGDMWLTMVRVFAL